MEDKLVDSRLTHNNYENDTVDEREDDSQLTAKEIMKKSSGTRKKRVGSWFYTPIQTWDIETCFKMLELSEFSQKGLPSFKSASKAKEAVIRVLRNHIEVLNANMQRMSNQVNAVRATVANNIQAPTNEIQTPVVNIIQQPYYQIHTYASTMDMMVYIMKKRLPEFVEMPAVSYEPEMLDRSVQLLHNYLSTVIYHPRFVPPADYVPYVETKLHKIGDAYNQTFK